LQPRRSWRARRLHRHHIQSTESGPMAAG